MSNVSVNEHYERYMYILGIYKVCCYISNHTSSQVSDGHVDDVINPFVHDTS